MSDALALPDRARAFHREHFVCDMIGLNLTHPRFLIDHIDLGVRQDSTCRGDFVKFAEWGLGLVVCKGGPVLYDPNFAALWPQQPEHRPGRPDAEPLYLSSDWKNPTQVVLAVLDRFLSDVEAHADKVRLVRRRGDIEAARQEGKVALLMGSNRSDWFGDCPGVLRMFARLGLRMITLSASGRDLGWDAYDQVRSGGRLSEMGARLIEEMNSQGILIDIAHNSEVCALDIIGLSARPVVDSHSLPRTLDDQLRNTSDRVMRALADAGGVLGLMPPIQRPPGEKPLTHVPRKELEDTVRLVRYAVDLMGVEGVGIGTHFNSAALPWVTDALLGAGFAEEQVEKIAGENYRRVLGEVLPT